VGVTRSLVASFYEGFGKVVEGPILSASFFGRVSYDNRIAQISIVREILEPRPNDLHRRVLTHPEVALPCRGWIGYAGSRSGLHGGSLLKCIGQRNHFER
jgi:hypothetical protein